jgi:hypothetical protein
MSAETYSTDGPICPYCGTLCTPDESWFYDEMHTQFECDSCGKASDMRIYNSTSWACSTVKPA